MSTLSVAAAAAVAVIGAEILCRSGGAFIFNGLSCNERAWSGGGMCPYLATSREEKAPILSVRRGGYNQCGIIVWKKTKYIKNNIDSEKQKNVRTTRVQIYLKFYYLRSLPFLSVPSLFSSNLVCTGIRDGCIP